MHARTRSQKPILVGCLEEVAKKRKGKNGVGIRHQQGKNSVEGSNEEEIKSFPLGSPKTKDQ